MRKYTYRESCQSVPDQHPLLEKTNRIVCGIISSDDRTDARLKWRQCGEKTLTTEQNPHTVTGPSNTSKSRRLLVQDQIGRTDRIRIIHHILVFCKDALHSCLSIYLTNEMPEEWDETQCNKASGPETHTIVPRRWIPDRRVFSAHHIRFADHNAAYQHRMDGRVGIVHVLRILVGPRNHASVLPEFPDRKRVLTWQTYSWYRCPHRVGYRPRYYEQSR